MAISLYDLSVTGYLQTLGAVGGFLDKGLSHCGSAGIDPEEIVETRLFPDMQPFRYQVQCIVHHSVVALEAVRNGSFRPPYNLPHVDYAALQALVADAGDALRKLTPDDINSREGAEVVFDVPNFRMAFAAENFLMSFSLPNFHFHATTAYDILRSKGVPIGKRDYLGALRVKA